MNRLTNWLWKQLNRDWYLRDHPTFFESLFGLPAFMYASEGKDYSDTLSSPRASRGSTPYTPVLNNPHFIHLTTLLSVPFLSSSWRREHPHVAFWTLERDFREAVQLLPAGSKQEVVSRLVDLLLAVTTADASLHYSTADMDWFIETVDRQDAKTVLSVFCACYSAPTGKKPDAEQVWQPEQGQVVISVTNLRCLVSRWEWSATDGSYTLARASNANELEPEAQHAIEAQGGAITISGIYACPAELAAHALFAQGDTQ